MTTILQFEEQGEKTGWSYIGISAAQAQCIKPGQKKTFRVKGKLDNCPISGMALLPMGGGNFIMALNAEVRKKIKKGKGAGISVQLEADNAPLLPDAELIECLEDEPDAFAYFNQLTRSHRNYFSNWVQSAKTKNTKAKRIAQTVTALIKKQNYGEMLRSLKNEPKERLG